MSSPWFQEIWRIVGLLVAALLGALLSNFSLSFCLLLAVSAYLIRHLRNLSNLQEWLSQKKTPVPDAVGIWGEVFYQLYRLQLRNRKRKRKLANMLKHFQRSTAAMPDAAVVLYGGGREIEWINKAATQLLGLKTPQDLGQAITNLIRAPIFQQYLYSGDEKHSIKMQSPSDSNIMLRLHIVPYSDNRHLLLARDITNLHRLEQIRRDFVANVSHELRTPLTVIAGFTETMLDAEDEFSRQWERPLQLMAQQTTRMQRIVDDLLLLSRLESDIPMGKLQQVHVAEILESIAEEARIVSGDIAHEITLDADPDLMIYGIPEELRSVFSNLVFNAVRYTITQGKIQIRWYADVDGIHFSVLDTGEGIAPEHLPRLTERFYRVDVARSRSQGGTGLGLAIVKHVLNRHHANLHIESTVGEGSLFRCDFPLSSAQQLLLPDDEGMMLNDEEYELVS
jgi:two-component system phosphate regulon sensor histidine kinase PhoR